MIEVVAVITANRPSHLSRVVSDLASIFRTMDRPPALLVIDGSQALEVQEANRLATVRSWKGGRYVGPAQARSVAGSLSGFDTHMLCHSLTTGTVGANRNLALLLAGSRRLVMIDDDVRPYALRRAHSESRVAMLGGHHAPFHTEFYRSRQEAREHVATNRGTLLAAHDEVLGLTLADLRGCRLDTSDACPALVQALHSKDVHRVAITMVGVVGDVGLHCPYSWLFADGPEARRLRSSDVSLSRAMSYREVVRIAPRLTITHDPRCMAYCIGLDGTLPLPPFIPVGRNEDGAFGYLTFASCGAALAAHLDIGVLHDSSRSSRRRAPVTPQTDLRVADFIIALVRRFRAEDAASAIHLERFGRSVYALSTLPDPAFRRLLGEIESSRLATLKADLQHVLDDEPHPLWRSLARQYKESLDAQSQRPDFGIPLELRRRGPAHGLVLTRSFLAAYGILASDWLTMRRMRSEGVI